MLPHFNVFFFTLSQESTQTFSHLYNYVFCSARAIRVITYDRTRGAASIQSIPVPGLFSLHRISLTHNTSDQPQQQSS